MSEKEVEIEVVIDKYNQEWEHYQMKERIDQDQNLDLDPIQEWVQTEIELGVIDVGSMITLQ